MKSLNIMIKPASSLCNMRCKYCFYADVSDRREIKSCGIMTNETQKLLLKRVEEEFDGGDSVRFIFQGGEPTLAGLSFFKSFIHTVQPLLRRLISVIGSPEQHPKEKRNASSSSSSTLIAFTVYSAPSLTSLRFIKFSVSYYKGVKKLKLAYANRQTLYTHYHNLSIVFFIFPRIILLYFSPLPFFPFYRY